MKKTVHIRLIALISAALMLFISAAVYPSHAISQNGSLTLICRRGNTILTGMNWRLYHVGKCQGDNYVLDGDFSNYPVLIDKKSANVMNNAAVTLENYAILDNLPYINSGVIDDEGYLTFPNLKSGLYMVSGDVFNIKETFYQPSAALIEINTDTDKSDVDLVVYPKVKYALLSEINLNNTVKKIWNDTKQSHEPIDVEIYKNSELHETVTLSEENSWTYSWKATDYSQWRVKEAAVPADYIVNYQIDNGKYAIENTFTGIEAPVVTTIPEPQKLPQTGQLWWPVIVMGSAGIILIIIGIKLKKRSKV